MNLESDYLLFLPCPFQSIYFDEPLSSRPVEQSSAGLPDWVTGELGPGEDTWPSSLLRDRTSSPNAAHRSMHRSGLEINVSTRCTGATNFLSPSTAHRTAAHTTSHQPLSLS